MKRVAPSFAYPSSTGNTQKRFHFGDQKSFPRLVGFKFQKQPNSYLPPPLSHPDYKPHKNERKKKEEKENR